MSPPRRTTRQQAKTEKTVAKPANPERLKLQQPPERIRNDYEKPVAASISTPAAKTIDGVNYEQLTASFEQAKLQLAAALKRNEDLANEKQQNQETCARIKEGNEMELSELRARISTLENDKADLEGKCLLLEEEKAQKIIQNVSNVQPLCTTCHNRASKLKELKGTLSVMKKQVKELLDPTPDCLTIDVIPEEVGAAAGRQRAVNPQKKVKKAQRLTKKRPHRGSVPKNRKKPKQDPKIMSQLLFAENSQKLIDAPETQLRYPIGTTGENVILFDNMYPFVCDKQEYLDFKKDERYSSRGMVYRQLILLFISPDQFIHLSIQGQYQKMNKGAKHKLASLHCGVKKLIEDYLGGLEEEEDADRNLAMKLFTKARKDNVIIVEDEVVAV